MIENPSNLELEIKIGDRVCLATAPTYFKTADPMPMLRPPDLVAVGEVGVVMEIRAGGAWAVKFNRGVFLIDEKYLALEENYLEAAIATPEPQADQP